MQKTETRVLRTASERNGKAWTAVSYGLDGRGGEREVEDKKVTRLRSQENKEDLETTTLYTLYFLTRKKKKYVQLVSQQIFIRHLPHGKTGV